MHGIKLRTEFTSQTSQLTYDVDIRLVRMRRTNNDGDIMRLNARVRHARPPITGSAETGRDENVYAAAEAVCLTSYK